MVYIGVKLTSIQKTAERLNSIGLAVCKFSGAMHVFNLDYPFEVAIISSDSCKGSIQNISQKIAESEAI